MLRVNWYRLDWNSAELESADAITKENIKAFANEMGEREEDS